MALIFRPGVSIMLSSLAASGEFARDAVRVVRGVDGVDDIL